MGAAVPFDGQVMLIAAAKASVPGRRLSALVERVQADLGGQLESYRRRHELVHETDEACYFLVPEGHWREVGDRLGFDDRERDAVERTHTQGLLWAGRRIDRREEFESALEIREPVVIGRPGGARPG